MWPPFLKGDSIYEPKWISATPGLLFQHNKDMFIQIQEMQHATPGLRNKYLTILLSVVLIEHHCGFVRMHAY
jgi:hypothetical protein